MIGDPQSIILLITGAVIGAVWGSFLNVVIHRTPRLIDAHQDGLTAKEFLRGLSWPASHCPKCAHPLRWRDNIPILSYVLLRGRCRTCGQKYGARYLAVEVLGAVIVAYCAVRFGPGAQAVFASIFGLGLLALTFIDIQEQLLPDVIVLPLLAVGLLFNSLYGAGPIDAVLGGALGFCILWAIRAVYRLARGIEGMGFGDLKLAAMIGAWLGLQAIPTVLLVAFMAGVVFMLPLSLLGRLDEKTPVPFGPFLALGGVMAVVLPNLPALFMGFLLP